MYWSLLGVKGLNAAWFSLSSCEKLWKCYYEVMLGFALSQGGDTTKI